MADECPKCGGQLEMFTSDEDWCPACTFSTPAVISYKNTIATLQQQVATLTREMESCCPKCEASLGSLRTVEGCVNCERVEAVRQLADARLLARAANKKRVWWDIRDGEVQVYDEHNEFAMIVDEGVIEHGLPILTNELRAALQKSVGE